MKKIISYLSFLLFFNVFLYPSSAPTSLIVIRGTANSGKTTLCNALQSLLLNSPVIVSQDDVHRKACYKVFTGIFPTDMALISESIAYENRWQAIKCGNIVFPKDIDKQKKQFIINAIGRIKDYFEDPHNNKQLKALSVLGKQKTMQKLIFYAAQGYNVIFDAWGVTNWDNELNDLRNYFSRFTIVSAYCSLQTVRQRWEHRNYNAIQTNNYTETRLMSQMLKSFFGFLCPQKPDDQQEHIIITKKECEELFQEAQQYTMNEPKNEKSFSMHEFTAEELLAFKNQIYAKFNFDKNEEVAIVPSVYHDISLCTEGNCDTYVAELLKKITLFFHKQ